MKYKVVYYTRTGHSKQIADKIAEHLQCESIAIKDHKNWKGLFGYIKAGFYAVTKRYVSITLDQVIGEYDQLICVCPLWASSLTPAIRTFLKDYPREKIHLVMSSMGSTLKDRTNFLSVTDIIEDQHHTDEVITRLISQLNK